MVYHDDRYGDVVRHQPLGYDRWAGAHLPPPDDATRAHIAEALRRFRGRSGWGPSRISLHLRREHGLEVPTDMVCTVAAEMED